jgi:hypothetical protein
LTRSGHQRGDFAVTHTTVLVVVGYSREMKFDDPWAWMQSYDVRRFGEVNQDKTEQERWCRAVLLAGLPFMWRKAEVARNVIYDQLELDIGDKVLLIGECIEPCGFVDDIRARIGTQGDIKVIDITDEARDNYLAKKRGRGGQVADHP